jgi:hypothetical protein
MRQSDSWPQVGEVDPLGLVDTRLQVHHAAQLVVSLGISFLAPTDDDSHTNLEWMPFLQGLAGRPLAKGIRGALRLPDLSLRMLDRSNNVTATYPLLGRSNKDGYDWLRLQLQEAGEDPARLTPRKHYTIPSHPVESGASFAADSRSLGELAKYYEGAADSLTAFARQNPQASEVRCWPHHFDIATLVTLRQGGPTIGLGLSPGDEHYPEPYYYVTPYPYPAGTLPPLPSGTWHTAGWIGAVLRGSTLAPLGASQQAAVRRFLHDSYAACRQLQTATAPAT